MHSFADRPRQETLVILSTQSSFQDQQGRAPILTWDSSDYYRQIELERLTFRDPTRYRFKRLDSR